MRLGCSFHPPERPGWEGQRETGRLFPNGPRERARVRGGKPGPSSVHLPRRPGADGPAGHQNVSGGHGNSCRCFGGLVSDGVGFADPRDRVRRHSNFGSAPRWTLASALPAAASGAPFLSPAAGISAHLRSQILAGTDINLVKILLCASDSVDRRVVECGEVSVFLKGCDPRMSKNLTLPEFYVAFGVFRDMLCEAYPERHMELDTYLALISDLAMRYGGTLFYEYHKSFSAKAALYVQKFNILLDWSVLNLDLVSRVFTGHMPMCCSVCGSLAHTVNLCPRMVFAPPAKEEKSGCGASTSGGRAGRRKVLPSFGGNTSLCINYNERVCRYTNCRFLHACSYCGDAHPRSVCPRRARPAPKGKLINTRQPQSTCQDSLPR